MNKKEIILVGGGGHCKSCIEVIESENKYSIAGIIDAKEKIGQTVLGYPIIGCDDDLPQLKSKYNYALITVGQIKSPNIRIKLFKQLKELNFILPVIIASSAVVSKHSKIDEGTIIMHQCMINADAEIGKNNIINTKALIEHDAKIGNHCHISTNTVINGTVHIGNENFIASNVTFVNNLTTTNNVFIGIGSVVTKHLTEPGIYLGSPVRKIR
jgi:sugar O-acyltransferase (sialic acid O-acetyltransferase NeuD family)